MDAKAAPDSTLSPAQAYPQADIVIPEVASEPDGDSSDGQGGEDALTEPADSDVGPLDSDDPQPLQWAERSCTRTLSYTPPSPVTTVHFATSALGWDNGAVPMTVDEAGQYQLVVDLSEFSTGSHGYKFIIDRGLASEAWIEDPANMMRRFDDGFVNSKLIASDCRAPVFIVEEQTISEGGQAATIRLSVRSGIGTSVDLDSLSVTHNFVPIISEWDADTTTVTVTLTDLPIGKHSLRFDIAAESDEGAFQARPIVISFWNEATPFEWRDASLYFAFTDRFRDAQQTTSPDPCLPPDSIANWLGGDWAGVTEAIEEGYFEGLGINALWLNAPMDNPEGCVSGLHDRQYTAFHGYFPFDLTATESRYGSLDDLRALVSAAHARGIRVLIDLPANHLFDTAPEWSQYGWEWFNDDGVCRELGWTTPETCWFEPYLPDLDYRNDEVVEYMSEAALQWALDADLDGFRVDAVKHMHPHFLNTLRSKLNTRIEAHSDQRFWTVGETFTGGWQSGGGSEAELVKAYVSDDQLMGQFDFPLFWPLRGAFAERSSPLTWLAEAALGSADFYGPDAVMGSFLGNHDVSRFITVAHGDNLDSCADGGTVVPWDCPPAQPESSQPYTRLLHAFTFLAAYTAVPLIYYGDEVGLAGAGDPDNRRMMPWGDLNAHQEALQANVSALFKARLSNVALRRGTFSVIEATDATLVIERSHADSRAYAVFNLSGESLEVNVMLTGEALLTEALSGATVESTGDTLSWSVPAETVGLWTTSP